MAQVAVLARFLSPEDYGLMALVSVVLSYLTLFGDMGLSAAYIQRQFVSHEERSSLFWFNVTIGIGVMLLVMFVSKPVASFFGEPQLAPALALSAPNFLAIALGQQLRIDAEKALNFRPVALIEMVSGVIGLVVSILAAWLGWGVYALVVATLASSWLIALLSWVALAKGWRPAWRLRWSEVRWFATFGGGMVLNNVINHVNVTIDILLGGRMLGAAQLGLYSVPRNLMLQVQGVVNPIFTRVGFPLIASIQHDIKRVRYVYLKTMNMTASVNAPIYVAVWVFAPEVVLILLGDRWQEAVPLLRLLSIWGLLRSFGNPVGTLLFGLGRVRLSAYWNIGLLFIVLPIVWFGSQWGAIGMAWAMVVLMAALIVPGWAILIRPTCGVGLWDYTKQVINPVLCALVAGGAAWLICLPITSIFAKLGVGLPIGALIYLLLSIKFNRDMIELVALSSGRKYLIGLLGRAVDR